MGVHAARRLEGFSYVGEHEYSLTFCTWARRRWFVEAACVERVRTSFLQLAGDERFDVIAYCFMPDHLHAFVTGTSATSDLQRFVGSWKQDTGFAHSQIAKARLW